MSAVTDDMRHARLFEAPWCLGLKVVTAFTCGLLLSMAGIGLANPSMPRVTRLLMVVLPPLGILAGALFTIRGYGLTNDALYVRRLWWQTRIRLSGLQSVEVDPNVTRGSWRSCGNGGFFCISGWFYNKKLGSFRFFGTDPKRAVVLNLGRRRVVVTPGDPRLFAQHLKARLGFSA